MIAVFLQRRGALEEEGAGGDGKIRAVEIINGLLEFWIDG